MDGSLQKDRKFLHLAAPRGFCAGVDRAVRIVEIALEKFGAPVYARIDAPATGPQKAVLKKLSPEQITADTLAGEPITAKLTNAPGNDAAIGGLKVTTENGWFAARPSGTEEIYKIYAESFKGEEHLAQIQEEAKAIVSAAFTAAGV